MSGNNASKWGFWIPVKDKSSAKYAAKMAGLPIFLLGIGSLISSFAFFNLHGPSVALINFLMGIFLFTSGLRIRSGKFGSLPIAVLIWILNAFLLIALTGISVTTIVTILIGLMAVSGLLGWYWLRVNTKSG